MILNAYTVLDLALVALRLPLGLFLIVWTWKAWRSSSGDSGGRHVAGTNGGIEDGSGRFEGRLYLSLMAAGLLCVLNVLAWPLIYAVLQSYIPQWPGVMCIYGVSQIGVGSEGPSRFLPGMLVALQIVKPLTVFLGGAWGWMYLASRRSGTAELQGRIALWVVAFGALTMVEATVEGAYLLTPKREHFAEAGCCTVPLEAELRSGRFVPRSWGQTRERGVLIAFFAVNSLLALLIGVRARQSLEVSRPVWLLLFLLAAISIPLNLAFFKEVATPRILHLEYHHCLYDLFVRAPESLVGAGVGATGVFSLGWARLVAGAERRTADPGRLTAGLLFTSALGFIGCVIHFSVALALV